MTFFHHVRTFIVVSLLTAAASHCGGVKEKEVVAIEKTKTFHRDSCPPVHMAKTSTMSLKQAQAGKLKPCPLCQPDRL